MQQLKIWIAIKQSTNLELNEPVFSGGQWYWREMYLEIDECERAHTLTTTTTGS